MTNAQILVKDVPGKKRRYTAPKIRRWGDLPQLTKGNSGGTFDQIFGGSGGFQAGSAS